MEISDVKYSQYLQILREELLPAMGCTEPIAMAYAAAKARQTLGAMPNKIDIVISGNIIKNVKSVVVPNTGGLKGIAAAVAAGTVVGDADKQLEVLSFVKPEEIPQIGKFMDECQMTVMKAESGKLLDIDLHMYKGTDSVRLRICDYHTNIVAHREKRAGAAQKGRKRGGRQRDRPQRAECSRYSRFRRIRSH